MFENLRQRQHGEDDEPKGSVFGWNLSRRGLFGATALLGLAATTRPAERALAWSSWTNATSSFLKKIGMGDCVHEDLVQIAYARMVRNHKDDTLKPDSLLNPWAGTLQADARYAEIAGDTVDAGEDNTFEDGEKLAALLYRENLAYLRIGSFWNDAAANTLADFAYSCSYANAVPKFSGSDHYEGAWDVGQHIKETNEKNATYLFGGLDALVQFTMNDRNNFIHGMLSSTASHSTHLKQADIKKFAMQWLGVAYEYARTGKVTTTSDVAGEGQAEKIFKGFIDTYGQLDENAHDMRVSLKVSSSEASLRISRRRLRLRALGMMCHTLEDLWCPSHTCRTYHEGGEVPKNSILAFSNYKAQNGDKSPMQGYHIPFDRYAISDAKNSVNWREALTRGIDGYTGTETLENALSSSMADLDQAHTFFNTLGMNDAIACITKLLEYLYQGTPWDGQGGVREWVDTEVMPTYFNADGQSCVCDGGRRCLHTPTFIISPINSMNWACRITGLSDSYNRAFKAAKEYDKWQRGAHAFYSGKYNTTQSKYITAGCESDSIWNDSEGERRLVALADALHDGFCALDADKKGQLLALLGNNKCHHMAKAVGMVSGMLQEFSIDLTGRLRSEDDGCMKELKEVRAFFESGLVGQDSKLETQSSPMSRLFAAGVAYADEGEDSFVTINMVLEDVVGYEDGSYLIAVRDMDSLMTSIMDVPAGTPGAEKLEEGLANLAITYTIEEEFETDFDYCYIVTGIDYPDTEEDVYLATGTVKSVAADKTSLVIDLVDIPNFELGIRSGLADIPQVGTYICARYAFGASGIELVGFDELDPIAGSVKVTYPVAKVAGSRIWLLTTGEDPESDGAYCDYLQIELGATDVRSIPQEGYLATVYYHDDVYGEHDGESGISVSTLGVAASFPTTYAQDDGDSEDSADTPGYFDLGDEYGQLNYGDEVFHVADVIVGSQTEADGDARDRVFGDYYDAKSSTPEETKYRYFSNHDGTHRKYSADPADATEENCTYDAVGICVLCGYAKQENEQKPQPVKRKKQTLKVSKATKRVRASRLKKKAHYTSKVKVRGAKTKVTYKRIRKGSSSRLTVNAKTGKIKVRRGTPEGTYRIKIMVTAARTTKYEAASRIATIKVIVS